MKKYYSVYRYMVKDTDHPLFSFKDLKSQDFHCQNSALYGVLFNKYNVLLVT